MSHEKQRKFVLGDKVFVIGLGAQSPIEGAVGTVVSIHEFAPGLTKHIVMLEKPFWTEEYRAIEVPSMYLRMA